jgi:hypothetical protein
MLRRLAPHNERGGKLPGKLIGMVPLSRRPDVAQGLRAGFLS